MCLRVKKSLFASAWAMQALIFLCASNMEKVKKKDRVLADFVILGTFCGFFKEFLFVVVVVVVDGILLYIRTSISLMEMEMEESSVIFRLQVK